MAMNTQDNSRRSAEARESSPTPVSGYLGLGIMAAIALMMVYLQMNGSSPL